MSAYVEYSVSADDQSIRGRVDFLAWLERHNIEPTESTRRVYVCGDGEIHATCYRRDNDGRILVDYNENAPVTYPVTRKLREELPDTVKTRRYM